MAAVVRELQAGDVLVVATEHGQQFTCGHLDRQVRRDDVQPRLDEPGPGQIRRGRLIIFHIS